MSERARRFRVGLAVIVLTVSAGSAYPHAADPLDSLKELLFQARFTEAETRARSLLAETEASSGLDSLAAARVLDALVEALWRGGKFRTSDAKALAERAVAIKETQLGSQHPELAYSLATLGMVLRLQSDYVGAQSMFDGAVAIQERHPEHPDLARTLWMAATLALDTGDVDRAEALYSRALAIRQQALPAGDPAIADSLNGLGLVRERKGDASGAEQYYEQALTIREQAFGPVHPDVATSLNNVANVKGDRGDYAGARSLHERALAIREQTLESGHPDIAMSLNNLAVAIRDLGDHAAAWWPLERVVGIYETRFGPSHPNVAIALHNLATLLVDLPHDDGTRLLAERARRFRVGGDERRHLMPALNDLVGLDPPLDSTRAARALLERALTIKEQALGSEHTSVAVTLTALASVHDKLGETDRAKALFERALAIREKKLGPMHPSLAETLNPFGELLVKRGDAQAAKPIYERVLTILEQSRGADHPHVAAARQHLAEVLASLGLTADALRMALDAERIARDHLRLIGRTLPEREALSYAATRAVGTDLALTLLASGESPTAAGVVWDAVIRSRALVLDEMASRHRTIRGADAPEMARLAKDLASRREHLAKLVVHGSSGPGEDYRRQLERARTERDSAERALAERSLVFRQEQRQQQLGLGDVRAALPSGSALVAFVRYLKSPLRTHTANGPATSTAAYLAFVVRAGEEGEPAVVVLGSASAIDGAIARWRKQMTGAAFAGGRSIARAETTIRESGAQLRAKIWDPLASRLAGTHRLFIVPDGALSLVNWGALPASGGRYLIEQVPPIHYLSAERDLVSGQPRSAGDGLLVVDSPVFDQPAILELERTATSFRSARSACGDMRSTRFDPLPASAREAATVSAIWRRSHGTASDARLTGRAATEAALKQRASGVQVLHLATHAFFLGSRCASRDGEMRRSSIEAARGGNPLLLAGFALTGANQREHAGADAEDGILTAEEVAALDLEGTDWAVLSACDTGVGEILAGEGVFGLRRAFQVAGARTVIMSLWPVDDEDTRRWMTNVYEGKFVRGRSTMDAVHASTLAQLRARRRAGLSTHPFYWAGFIAAGDWH
jgi:CHAT domain-containing protein/tetratricopeptide (TPR) repeat protein